MSSPNQQPAMFSIYDGRTCQGFVLCRGKAGYEAFDRNDRSRGIFKTLDEAAAAVTATKQEAAS
jgi:hypothetical protein